MLHGKKEIAKIADQRRARITKHKNSDNSESIVLSRVLVIKLETPFSYQMIR